MKSGYTNYYHRLSQQETATRLCRTKPAGKIIMAIFWDRSGFLLSEYLPGGTMISGCYYVSIIERLRGAIVEKRGSC